MRKALWKKYKFISFSFFFFLFFFLSFFLLLISPFRAHPTKKGVPLELFHFSRLVVDEFSYYLRKEETLYQGRLKLDFFIFYLLLLIFFLLLIFTNFFHFFFFRKEGREKWAARSLICDGVSADCRWALSGTPPLGSFDQVLFSLSLFLFSLTLSFLLPFFSLLILSFSKITLKGERCG